MYSAFDVPDGTPSWGPEAEGGGPLNAATEDVAQPVGEALLGPAGPVLPQYYIDKDLRSPALLGPAPGQKNQTTNSKFEQGLGCGRCNGVTYIVGALV